VTLVPGALDDPLSLREAADGVDGVIHAAGLVKARSPADFLRTNCEGTANLLEAVRESAPDLRRFVLVSSLAVTGPSPDGTPLSTDGPPQPVTHYGASKLAAEQVAIAAAESVPVTILRPPMIYGPRDPEMLPVFKAVRLGVLPLTGPPGQLLSAIYASDCADACVQALGADVPSGTRLHLDDGQPLALSNLISNIENALDRRAWMRLRIPQSLLYLTALGTEVYGRLRGTAVMLTRDKLNELHAPHWVCDSAEARAALDWEPRITFPEGARLTADWYRQEGWL
jgi:nucleoside-diphosphate-sugar epimerase